MKVVVAHNRYRSAQPSGENMIVEQEIAELRAVGVEVLPFLRDSDDIARMSPAARVLLPASPVYNRSAQRELSALLTVHRPDVLHLHNPYPLLSPWVVRTAHRHGVPVVQTVHNYRHVCSPGLYYRDGHVCQDCRGRLLRLPGVVHGCYRGSRAQSAVMAAALAVHRPTWRSVDRYLALTSAIAAHLGEYGIPAERIVVKPNSVPDPGPPGGPGTGFLFLGRLTPEKGLDLLLAAWRRHPDGALGPLRIAGDGPQRPLAEAAAAEREDVTFLGPLPRARVLAELRATAVVVVPSILHDVLPTVAIEALAHGRPVLGTALGGIPYVAGTDEPTARADERGPAPGAGPPPGPPAARPAETPRAGPAGWTVVPDPAALAAALPVAHAAAPALGPTARSRYERHFHPEVITRRLLDVYADLASAAGPPTGPAPG
ncbi:MAG TPA: glycosyltransferase family 4 protein [Pilimelia sp.]|nr:glycosyltransferase family 4 protein [Pilimelia sp.]